MMHGEDYDSTAIYRESVDEAIVAPEDLPMSSRPNSGTMRPMFGNVPRRSAALFDVQPRQLGIVRRIERNELNQRAHVLKRAARPDYFEGH
jgi:hypothetical protein